MIPAPKGVPEFLLAVVLILVVVLVVILVLVIILILLVVLIAILVIHNRSSENLYLRHCRLHSVSVSSGLILCLKHKTCKKTRCNGSGDSTGAGFQPSGENSEEAILLYGFLDTLGQI